MTRILFTGAHRAGKTTLARRVASEYNLPYIASDAGRIATEMGVDLKGLVPLDLRIDYQTAVMADLFSKMSAPEAANGFVSDRAPLDLAAYLLADITAAVGTPDIHERIMQYVDQCIRATRNMADVVFLIPPGIPVEDHPHKPKVNPAYQWHHHFLVSGFAHEDDLNGKIARMPLEVLSRNQRWLFVAGTIEQRLGIKPLAHTLAA